MTQPTRLRPLSTDNYPRELVEDGGKLYFIDEDGNSSPVGMDVDESLSKTSENPVQNKVVATEIEGMKNATDTHVANKENPHAVTAEQVGLGNVDNTSDADKPVSTAQATAIGEAKTIAESAQTTADTHAAKTNNPHSVTAEQVGLGNVDNTSDADKPVSTAQATAIAEAKKAGTDAQDDIDTHTENVSNPHNVTAEQVGLGNVNNTSDANKPVSTAQATAIADAKKAGTDAQGAIDAHEADKENPHGVTAAQVGLGNVTNESKATMFTSPAFTGTPTAPTAGSTANNTQVATTAFVQAVVSEKLASSDAMFFKGTIGSTGATVTTLPAAHTAGWTYKVATAGTYAGVACEIGDLIICVTDGTAANNAHWTVVQNNIDGAVTGPAGSVDSHIAVFDGATGRIIKDSGFTIGASVPADAKFTDTVYTHPTGAGNNHIPAGGAAGKFLKWSSDGVAVWDVIPEYASAGEGLGLVTTGGDVTIENGVITVNDNSHAHTIANVTGLQDALDGKAPSSHGTHVSYDTAAPKANGTASAGSSAAVARADHVHPLQTSISGNAASATKATNDSEDQAITGYIRGLSVSGKVITYTRGDGTTGTITTQDTDTTYTLGSFGITASAAELNYVKGVTSAIQTQLDGKAPSSHGTHVSFSTTVPAANGTAAVGTATTVARSDHVHPLQTTISGNAASATKATNDSANQAITGYIRSLSVSGKVITYTRGDGTTGTITTQDTDTTYTLGSFGITATAAELNYCDGVTSNIQTQLDGKAPTSHGNHVPTVQTANNAIFLRNDNTWQTVTPANIGAAASSHTHSTYMPIAGGTFTGKAYAQANTSYTTYQLRNIALSTSAATPTGNGSILGVYS